MEKFLNTRKVVSEIEDLIKNADQRLILVAPYLKISKDFKELLGYRNKNDKITTVSGRNEISPRMQGALVVVNKIGILGDKIVEIFRLYATGQF